MRRNCYRFGHDFNVALMAIATLMSRINNSLLRLFVLLLWVAKYLLGLHDHLLCGVHQLRHMGMACL
jgi:hypothetical protein